ncbi:recombination protein RecR [candidate division WOR-3 bacterium]|uniref:Recombination protein RecR n=1 Tax=candidate division WOR-3 bacterium TaxID=2052148 RepID=A0A660SG95_UNCW3|nr:MAG: recombination protein RecR [candidate division WOR-3 bacterium]
MEKSLERLIERLQILPGVGRKTAQRLAFFLLRIPEEEVRGLVEAILDAKTNLNLCEICFNYTKRQPCSICGDEDRDHSLICVVETPAEILPIERSGRYRGVYHVLHGVLSPMDGIGPEDLRIKELVKRLKDTSVNEVIIATNPTSEGEATAIYLARTLKPLGVKVTRLARGLPMGADLDLADDQTIWNAIEGRREL